MGLQIDLTGKHAVITGGSRGIGRATAVLLAQSGAAVGISYASRHEDARGVVKEIEAAGGHAWAQVGDLAKPEEVDRLFERAGREFGGLDIFVGNHGIWPPADVPLERMSDTQWHRTIAVNLDSMFYTTRAAARLMRSGGSIVLVSSTAGQRGEAGHADYAATKGAIISMVKGLCVELGGRDIRVNSVAPGWVDTDMSASALTGTERKRIETTIPLRRVATAEDVAGPIVFLCCPLARHMTGEILNVNGGSVLVG
ncbi:MAG: SDR family oxidoreductase [Gemmatimonadetes bacterium]|nr:SDR family oxidoreductase [Gemmatimonadota bacterium]